MQPKDGALLIIAFWFIGVNNELQSFRLKYLHYEINILILHGEIVIFNLRGEL